MKKTLLIISVVVFVLMGAFSASALENKMTTTSLVSTSGDYTFECVINPTITSNCMPVLAAFDSDGVLCGLMFGDTVSITKGVPTVKTFNVTMTSAPSSMKLMLLKANGSYSPICKAEQIPTTLYTEKYGMITSLNNSNNVQIFSTDGSNATYALNDDVILSHGSTVISDKVNATNYINTLKFTYYTRAGVASTAWGIFSNERTCFKDTSGSAAQVYKYPDFRDNYIKRVVRFLTTSDGKVSSVSFADDTLYKKITSGDTLTAAYYTPSDCSFNDKYTLSNDAKILYVPARDGASTSDYTVKTPSGLKEGNYYHAKLYTTSDGREVVLLTYMFTDSELTTFNAKPTTHINTTLNGNGSTLKGINNFNFSIPLNNPANDNDFKASDAASAAMDYVAEGLQGALDLADSGYAITPEFVKLKFKSQISAAKAQLKIITDLDKSLGSNYYGELENKIPLAIGNESVSFLKDYFLD